MSSAYNLDKDLALPFGRGFRLTILFNVKDLRVYKRAYPGWVIVLGDKAKNSARLVGSWKELRAQTMQESCSCRRL